MGSPFFHGRVIFSWPPFEGCSRHEIVLENSQLQFSGSQTCQNTFRVFVQSWTLRVIIKSWVVFRRARWIWRHRTAAGWMIRYWLITLKARVIARGTPRICVHVFWVIPSVNKLVVKRSIHHQCWWVVIKLVMVSKREVNPGAIWSRDIFRWSRNLFLLMNVNIWRFRNVFYWQFVAIWNTCVVNVVIIGHGFEPHFALLWKVD